MNPKIDVVVSTLAQRNEILDLVFSINKNTPINKILIIIEESNLNDKQIIDILLATDNVVLYLTTARGVCAGRNLGVELSLVENILLIDDDCMVTESFNKSYSKFIEEKYDCMFAKVTDHKGRDVSGHSKFLNKDSYLTKDDYEYKFNEIGMLVKKSVFSKIYYDESLGPGFMHGSSEAFDIVMRMLNAKYKLFYNSNYRILHPDLVLNKYQLLHRTYVYSIGNAYILSRHNKKLLIYKSICGALIRILQATFTSNYFEKNRCILRVLGLLTGLYLPANKDLLNLPAYVANKKYRKLTF